MEAAIHCARRTFSRATVGEPEAAEEEPEKLGVDGGVSGEEREAGVPGRGTRPNWTGATGGESQLGSLSLLREAVCTGEPGVTCSTPSKERGSGSEAPQTSGKS